MAYSTIKDPSAHFQTALYAGNNTTDHNITNDGNSDLQPDLVWIKQRTSDNPHVLQDTSRGFNGSGLAFNLQTNSTAVEGTNGAFESFNTNGFGVGGTNVASGAYNLSGSNYVAWQWKANGGTTASNTDGDLTSTVQFNSTAGFSIVTYTGIDPIEPLQVGHGMGEAPDVIIIKNRSSARLWAVYHKELTSPAANRYLQLNTSTYGELANSTLWGNVAPSSTIITTGENAAVNQPNENLVAYCWKERQGFSKFGKYVGNGNANGTFVYTGFKPAFVLWRIISSSGDWRMVDTKRGVNGAIPRIKPNASSAEGSAGDNVDLLSNGFKFRSTAASANASGASYIYMAFAENPFTTSTGIPTTAR